MQHVRTYIRVALAVCVMTALLLPGVVMLAHSFENHDHLAQCENPNDIHVHKKELDCDFHSVHFKNNGVIAFAKVQHTFSSLLFKNRVHYTQKFYTFSIDKCGARGPPSGDFLYS